MPKSLKSKSDKKKDNKYQFTLKGIIPERIDKKYGITLSSNIGIDKPDPELTTTIDEIEKIPEQRTFLSYLDEAKHPKKCSISMIDFETNKNHSDRSYYHCFWDRHPFPIDVIPIGCPIRYVPHQIVKNYYSEISREKYIIKENVPYERIKELKDNEDDRFSVIPKGFYVTDGAFCSFTCCREFLRDLNIQKNPLYKDSKMLLIKMYNETFDTTVEDIPSGLHWKQLLVYGGDKTIESFRDNNVKIEYTNHGDFIDYPRMLSRGTLFESNIKF